MPERLAGSCLLSFDQLQASPAFDHPCNNLLPGALPIYSYRICCNNHYAMTGNSNLPAYPCNNANEW